MGAALDWVENQTARRFKTLDERTIKNYNEALEKCIERYRALLKIIADIDSGKIKPPKTYETEKQIARWRKEYVNKAIRQSGIIQGMAKMLAQAGVTAVADIKQVLRDEYAGQYLAAGADISDEAQKASVNISFAQLDARQLDIIMAQEENRPFSKIAYESIEDKKALEKSIQDAMFQAALRGESQADIVRRLRNITGYQAYRCRRIAQTEHTRIQSQARYQAGNEAKQKGVGVYNTWSTRMINSRDSHISLNGKTAMQGEPFTTSLGNKLLFPGDPSAPAEEVINCHCVLVSGVLLPGETLESLNPQGESGIIKAKGKVLTKIEAADIPSMDEHTFLKIKNALSKQGVTVIQDKEGDAFLEYMGAEALTISDGSAVIFQSGRVPSASAVFEEVIHVKQIKSNGAVSSDDVTAYLNREIEANEKVLANKKAYKLTALDIQSIEKNLAYYYKKLKEVNGSV